MPANDLAADKAACREKLKKIRSAIPREQRLIQGESICSRLLKLRELRSARSVFLFISYGSEVHTHALLEALLAAGKALSVPKIIDSTTMIATPFTDWDDLVEGQLGILTPRGSEPYSGSVDVAITPGLGFTRSGHRIGYGRGYYDKWFAEHPATRRIAVSYSAQILEEIPVDNKDVLMHRIITEEEMITPGSGQ